MHRPFRHLAAVVVLVLGACATPPETVVERRPLPLLEAYDWHLHSATDSGNRPIEALASRDGQGVVFRFSGNRLDIGGACSLRGGNYQIRRAGLVFAESMPATMKTCEPSSMQADAALSQLLTRPLQIDVTDGAGPRLRLISSFGDTLVFSGRRTPAAR